MDKSLHCIFDMNESRVYSRDPELKCNNAEWQSHITLCSNATLHIQGTLTDAYHFSHLLPVCDRLFRTMSVKSRQLILLNFEAQDHFEATVPASLSIVLLPCLLSSSISFLAFLFCVVLGGSNSKIALYWQRNPSLT